VPAETGSPIPFNMLLNLASVVNAETPEILWGFIRRYLPDAGPETQPFLARLVTHAIEYYRDIVRPTKRFRAADETERAALADLAETLRGMDPRTDAETIQTAVYDVGKRHPFRALKDWFGCLYQVLLGQQEGPRFGGFVALYGVAETVVLIETALTTRRADTAA
jgi:lysyl-tRNA synthetase class 1